MRPIIYYGNVFAFGVLSGTNTEVNEPTGAVRRVSDADLSNPYQIVDGDPSTVEGIVSGEVAVFTDGSLPTGFAMVIGSQLSGFQARLLSEDIGGGAAQVHDSRTLSGNDAYHFAVTPLSSGNQVWRYELSGTTSGIGIPQLNEIMLGVRYQLPRSPEVGVGRTKQRRFDRLAIPGGQPFLFRQGSALRQRAFRFYLISGTETEELDDFLDGVDGGDPFFLVDDHGEGYWAELVGNDQASDDQAGVHLVALTFCEIRKE
jgi:hypothetical protein